MCMLALESKGVGPLNFGGNVLPFQCMTRHLLNVPNGLGAELMVDHV